VRYLLDKCAICSLEESCPVPLPAALAVKSLPVSTQVPGHPRAIVMAGHTPGSTAYQFTDRGLLFTGDALVTRDSLTGHTGPTLICRGSTHDSAAALAALDRLDELAVTILLPGHGRPFTGAPRAAAQQARSIGIR
jgi:glyoxylase-like metal-dependent hydrolase (beta-lactamase superfamily II)